MNNPGLTKSMVAASAIAACALVKFAADGERVEAATAVTDDIIGVNESLDVVEGERVDIIFAGIAEVRYGGTVAAGKRLTADADGVAVQSSAATDKVIGVAMQSGVSGDIGSTNIQIK